MNERFANNLKQKHTLNPSAILNEFKQLTHSDNKNGYKCKQKKEIYTNFPIAFDIETTNVVHDDGTKSAYMYAFTLCVNGLSYIGRTWEDLHIVLDQMRSVWEHKIIIYVQNLDFEFQFIKDRFEWSDMLCVDTRKPVKAITEDGFVFRCTAKMSNASLDTIGKNLVTYKVKKLVGDLDYNKMRNSKTTLTDEELGYIENDGKVVCAYIQEFLDQGYTNIKIPNTSTGFVREFCRKKAVTFRDEMFKASKEGKKVNKKEYDVRTWKLTEHQFNMCATAFMGGVTHANADHVGAVLHDVQSYDFASSYPAVMISEEYPCGSPVETDITTLDQFERLINARCCVFCVRLFGVKQKASCPDSYISKSKCMELQNPIINNGRVYSADMLSTTITNVDFGIIKQCYDIETFEVWNFMYWRKAHLPKYMIDSVLELFEGKSTLKGVAGKETEYMMKKAMLNSLYGMCVTNPIKPDCKYNGNEWVEETTATIDDYNKDKTRFLYYPWGIFVTAYARRNLMSGVLELGNDYLYSDTDSVKFINPEKHQDYFNNYNENILNKIYTTLNKYGYADYKLPKPLGIWDDDGHYKGFKTLGAKRYITLNDKNEFKITVAGLAKTANKYIWENGGFEFFNDGMEIPADYINHAVYVTAGGFAKAKMCHSYIDAPTTEYIVDYKGIGDEMSELSSVCLTAIGFKMSLADDYRKYLAKLDNFVNSFCQENV